MGTPSTIAILNKDGTVDQINTHYDGFVQHTGTILLCFYQDVNKVKELIKLGDLSGLQKEIHPPIGVEHKFGKPADEVTVFYGRDKGEVSTQANKYNSYDDYLAIGIQETFNYLFDEKKNKRFFLDPYAFKIINGIKMETEVDKQSLAIVVKDHKEEMNSIVKKHYEAYLKKLKIEQEYRKVQKDLPNQDVTSKKNKIKM